VTSVMTSRSLNKLSRAMVYLTCENFQRVGAFKFRGAYNAVASLDAGHEKNRSAVVVTLPSGNHAQGVAIACRLLGRSAHIVMHIPINPIKRAAVANYGASIHETPDRESAEGLLKQLMETLGARHVHALRDPMVVVGQGTCIFEPEVCVKRRAFMARASLFDRRRISKLLHKAAGGQR